MEIAGRAMALETLKNVVGMPTLPPSTVFSYLSYLRSFGNRLLWPRSLRPHHHQQPPHLRCDAIPSGHPQASRGGRAHQGCTCHALFLTLIV